MLGQAASLAIHVGALLLHAGRTTLLLLLHGGGVGAERGVRVAVPSATCTAALAHGRLLGSHAAACERGAHAVLAQLSHLLRRLLMVGQRSLHATILLMHARLAQHLRAAHHIRAADGSGAVVIGLHLLLAVGRVEPLSLVRRHVVTLLHSLRGAVGGVATATARWLAAQHALVLHF